VAFFLSPQRGMECQKGKKEKMKAPRAPDFSFFFGPNSQRTLFCFFPFFFFFFSLESSKEGGRNIYLSFLLSLFFFFFFFPFFFFSFLVCTLPTSIRAPVDRRCRRREERSGPCFSPSFSLFFFSWILEPAQACREKDLSATAVRRASPLFPPLSSDTIKKGDESRGID